MKIVNIAGGLGNQMFQYAFALALKHRHPNEEVLIDTQHYHTLFFKKFRGINLHNGFEINKTFPNATLPIAKWWQLMKITYWVPNYILSRIMRKLLPIRKSEYVAPYSMSYAYDEEVINNDKDCYYEGYWQSVRYYLPIKDILYKVYAHPKPNEYNANLIQRIESSESVGIHVRRGDYLSEPSFRGICGQEYYREAISQVLQDGMRHTFYVFSNDIKWCKANLLELMDGHDCVFVTGNTGKNSCWDMFLMTHCKDLIIANSSFSWWGAFLNQKVDRVFAPYPWLNRDCELDVYDDSWIKVKQAKLRKYINKNIDGK